MSTVGLVVALLVAVGTPKVGDIAPDFRAKDVDGKDVSLSQLASQGPVLLAFFPKSFTPGCTKQLSAYASEYAELREKNAQVVAVSMDDQATQKKFKESLGAGFIFVPDPHGKIVRLFDLRDQTQAKRAAFVIDRERRVLRVDLGEHAVDSTDKTIKSCETSG